MASTLPDEQLWMWMTQGSASARTARQQRKGACSLKCLLTPCTPHFCPISERPPCPPPRSRTSQEGLLIIFRAEKHKIGPCIWTACCWSVDMNIAGTVVLPASTSHTLPQYGGRDSLPHCATLSGHIVSHSVPTCSLACLDQGIPGVRKLLAALQISSGPQHP